MAKLNDERLKTFIKGAAHGRMHLPLGDLSAVCADLIDARKRIEELEGALRSNRDVFSKIMERGSEVREGGGFKKVDPALVFLPALHAKAAINNILKGEQHEQG